MNSIEKLTAIREFNTQVSRIIDMVSDHIAIIGSTLDDISESKKVPPLFLFTYSGYRLERNGNNEYFIVKGSKKFPEKVVLIGTDGYMSFEEVLEFAEIAPGFLLHFIQMLAM